MRKYWCVWVLLLSYWNVMANNLFLVDTTKQNSTVVIEHIVIKGNKRTKAPVILRELDIEIGDTLVKADLVATLTENENQIYNTRLFNEVKIETRYIRTNAIELTIHVEERWYIFPAVIFELTDPNFNVWWNTFHHDFRRTEYGIRFKHYNFRGRKEELISTIQFGFTKKFELSYRIPFIDKKQRIGLKPSISYITNKNVTYQTEKNKPQNIAAFRSRFRTGIQIRLRQNIRTHTNINFVYHSNHVADTIAQLNPNYFLAGQTKQRFFYAAYALTKDYRDIAAYPLEGYLFRLQIEKFGLGILDEVNVFWVLANYSQYKKMGKNFYTLLNLKCKVSFPQRQPYFTQRGLTGLDYVRGYELFQIDAQHFGLVRTAIKYQLFDVKWKNNWIKLSQFHTIPLAAYIKIHGEAGYARDRWAVESNALNNQLLYGAGVGLDIVTAYDNVFSLEYTRNAHGRWGLYVGFAVNYDL